MSWWYNFIFGSNSNDSITGTSMKDIIFAKGGDDEIYAGDGDDIIFAGKGDDTVYGGNGNDKIFGGKGDDTIFGENGHDWIWAGADNDTVSGGNGHDFISGGRGDDDIMGNDGNDWIYGGSGKDVINAGGDSDVIYAGSGDDTITHNITDNLDAWDYANGGSGYDKLVVEVTAAQFAEIDAAGILDDFNAAPSWKLFNFNDYNLNFSFDLQVRHIEELIFDIDNTAPTAVADNLAVDDSVDSNVVVLGNILDNDTDPDANDTKSVFSVANLSIVIPSLLSAVGSLDAVADTPQAGEVARYVLTPTGELANEVKLGGVEDPAVLVFKENGEVELTKNNALDFIKDGEDIQISFDYVAVDAQGAQSLPVTSTITVNGTDNKDVVVASGGPGERLAGGADDDVILGSANNELIRGNDGNDVIEGKAGDDNLDGGDGIDTVVYQSSNPLDFNYTYVSGTFNVDVVITIEDIGIDIDEGTDTLANFEKISFAGTTYNLILDDDAEFSTFGGNIDESDLLVSFNIFNAIAGDVVENVIGNNISTSDDIIISEGLQARAAGDAIINSGTISLAGNDILQAKGANGARLLGDVETNNGDIITAGDDTLYGSNVGDNLHGEANSNSGTITNAGHDILHGGAGNDLLYGEGGTNSGSILNAGDDILNGGEDNDTLYGETRVNSNGGRITTSGNDTLNGGAGSDVLFGDVDANAGILTTAGNDTLNGGIGSDSLYGDVRTEVVAIENAGMDTFVFDLDTAIGSDLIHDFNKAGTVSGVVLDKLQFNGVGDQNGTADVDVLDLDIFIANSGGSVFENSGNVVIDIDGSGLNSVTILGAATGSINSAVDLEAVHAGNQIMVF